MKKSIIDYDLKDKKVIIRCDLNVPLKDGKIIDDNRIKESIKTIKYAADKGAKVIIMSHLGRIKSEDDKNNNSLKPISVRLSKLLKKNVEFINKTQGCVVEEAIGKMKSSDIILIENTRFEDYPDKKESSNDDALAKYWASLGDIFINDAFGVSHRENASNVGIAKYLDSGIGFLVEKEIKKLSSILEKPKSLYTVIIGGAKMNDKIKVIEKLIEKADHVLLAGGIANMFLVTKGYDLKNSIYDKESIPFCKKILSMYDKKIILPIDGYSSSEYKDGLEVKYSSVDKIPDGMMMLDIGPKTIDIFKEYILKSKTIFWNGPVGVSEFNNFEFGTRELCKILKESSAEVVIGGGDSAAAAIRFGYQDAFAHISTGGGASLEFIEGKKLPGIEIIDEK